MRTPPNIPVGTKVNFLTTISLPFMKNKRNVCRCKCECGKELDVHCYKIKLKRVMSCGCRVRVDLKTNHPFLNIYHNIKRRCYNVKDKAFPRYGGRGIKVSDEWLCSFEQFCLDMGDRPSMLHTVDRIDNNKGYSKDNCRWATYKEQNNNTRRTLFFEHEGSQVKIDDLMSKSIVPRNVLWKRLSVFKWDVKKAISTPNRCKPKSPTA